jgi:hypothetical protein
VCKIVVIQSVVLRYRPNIWESTTTYLYGWQGINVSRPSRRIRANYCTIETSHRRTNFIPFEDKAQFLKERTLWEGKKVFTNYIRNKIWLLSKNPAECYCSVLQKHNFSSEGKHVGIYIYIYIYRERERERERERNCVYLVLSIISGTGAAIWSKNWLLGLLASITLEVISFRAYAPFADDFYQFI